MKKPWVGEANRCRIWKEESLKKMSLAHKGKSRPSFSEEWCEKISISKKGVSNPKVAEANRRRVWSIESLRKMSEVRLGKHMPESHRKKLRERILSEEHKRRISEALKGKPKSDEHRKNMSLASPERMSKLKHVNTSIERAVNSWLTEAHIDFVSQYPIGGRIYDFGIVEKKILVECDGTYWHSLPNTQIADKKKDLIASNFGWKLIRLPEIEFKSSLARHKLFSIIRGI